MEWLLAHSDDTEVVPECVSADSTNSTESNPVADTGAGVGASASASSSSTNEPTPEVGEVKSFKCEEW